MPEIVKTPPNVTANEARAASAAARVARALIETVAEARGAGCPVPSGHVYAALMHHGVTLTTYELLIDKLVELQYLKRGPHHTLELGTARLP